MSAARRIAWIVPTSGYRPEEHERRRQIIAGYLAPGIELDVMVPGDGPEFLDTGGHFDVAKRAALDFVAGVDVATYPVVILGGAIDPGLAALRAATAATVVGPAESCLFLAKAMGARVSIVTVDEHAVAVAEGLRAAVPWADLVSVRAIGLPVRTIDAAGDEGRARAREAVLSQARTAVEADGATAIQLGAMTLAAAGAGSLVREQLGVPVLDPIAAAVAVATQCLQALDDGGSKP